MFPCLADVAVSSAEEVFRQEICWDDSCCPCLVLNYSLSRYTNISTGGVTAALAALQTSMMELFVKIVNG